MTNNSRDEIIVNSEAVAQVDQGDEQLLENLNDAIRRWSSGAITNVQVPDSLAAATRVYEAYIGTLRITLLDDSADATVVRLEPGNFTVQWDIVDEAQRSLAARHVANPVPIDEHILEKIDRTLTFYSAGLGEELTVSEADRYYGYGHDEARYQFPRWAQWEAFFPNVSPRAIRILFGWNTPTYKQARYENWRRRKKSVSRRGQQCSESRLTSTSSVRSASS